MTPVVILGEGYAGATMMGVVRSLGRLKIPISVLSSHPHSPARFSRYCRYYRVPDVTREPDALEKLLIEHAKGLPSRPILFPIGDGEVMFLGERADRIRSYYRFNLAGPELIRNLANKQTQYEITARAGIQIPRVYFGIDSTNASRHDVEFPVVIKPVYSHLWPWRGITKALSAENITQLQERLKEMEGRRIQVVVQSIIPGPTSELYTVIAYISKTGPMALIASLRKLRHFPLDFGFGSLNEAVRLEELETQVLRFLRKLDFTGVCGVEFKRDTRDGQFKFIELNPRFELAHHLIATAGVDVARAMYADVSGHKVPVSTHRYRVGMRWISLTLDLKASRALFARRELSFSEWVRSMRNIRTEALLTWDDPWPGLCSYGRTLRCALLTDYLDSRREASLSVTGEAA